MMNCTMVRSGGASAGEEAGTCKAAAAAAEAPSSSGGLTEHVTDVSGSSLPLSSDTPESTIAAVR